MNMDLSEKFADACINGDFDTFKNCIDNLKVLQVIDKNYLKSCIGALKDNKRIEYLNYLSKYIDINVLLTRNLSCVTV